MSSDFESFEDVLNSIKQPPKEDPTFTIALGDYFEDSTAILTFWKMKASLFFGTKLLAIMQDMQVQRCQEDLDVMQEMAFVIASHKEPEAETPHKLIPGYINIFAALSEIKKWQFLQEFKEKGGKEFMDKMLSVIAAKKNCTVEEMLNQLIEQSMRLSASASATSDSIPRTRNSRSKSGRT